MQRCWVCFWNFKGAVWLLDQGFKHWRILFVTCRILHNMMLDEMVREQAPPRVGCGCCVLDDCVWLDGHTELSMEDKNPTI